MFNKIPTLPGKPYFDRAERWRRQLSFEAVERACSRPVTAAHYHLAAKHRKAAGRKIAFFSDLHCREGAGTLRIVEHAAKLIADFRPDYLVCGGDLVGDACEIDCAMEMLKKFDSAPVRLAAVGNWERSKFWLEPDFWKESFASAGFRVLINELYTDEYLSFYGLDDPKGGAPRGAVAWPAGVEKVLISHNPDTAIMIDFAGLLGETDLILSGHTHGGQVRLPGIGALVTSSLYRQFDAGLFTRRKSGTGMIITSGLGSRSFPIRFRCPPEVVLITLTEPEKRRG